MKKPDEIKKGLKEHAEDCCCDCPYWDNCNVEDAMVQLAADALALIQQLEADVESLRKFGENLSARNEELHGKLIELEAERDAAVAELANSDSPCDFCKYLNKFAHETPCNNCVHVLHGEDSQFKWRGVQKEDSDAVSS